MTAIPLYKPVARICPICREMHYCASEAAFARKVDECRNAFIGFMNNREYIRRLDTTPSYSGPDAETQVKG